MKAARELFDALRGWQWWPLIASLVLILVFLAGFFWRSDVSAVLCTSADDEHCGREWASALSGWAAFAAAIVTMRFLKRQIEESNRHQRENLELTAMGPMRVAQKCYSICSDLSGDCHRLNVMYGPDPNGNFTRSFRKVDFASLLQNIEEMQEKFSSPDITAFQEGMGWPGLPLEIAHEDLASLKRKLEEFLANVPWDWAADGRWLATLSREINQAMLRPAAIAGVGEHRSMAFMQKWGSRFNVD